MPLSLNNNAIASQIQRLCRVKAVTLRTTYLQRDFKGIENENEGQNNSVQKRHLWGKKRTAYTCNKANISSFFYVFQLSFFMALWLK